MRGPSPSSFSITVVVVTLWIVAAASPGVSGGVPATRRVDVSSSEAEPSQSAYAFLGRAVSGNGRFVVFCSADPGLVPNDTNGVSDVFIRGPLT